MKRKPQRFWGILARTSAAAYDIRMRQVENETATGTALARNELSSPGTNRQPVSKA